MKKKIRDLKVGEFFTSHGRKYIATDYYIARGAPKPKLTHRYAIDLDEHFAATQAVHPAYKALGNSRQIFSAFYLDVEVEAFEFEHEDAIAQALDGNCQERAI